MLWTRSSPAWVAALVALFALLRALRRLVEPEDRPVALVVAVVVVAAATLIPPARGPGRVSVEQAGWRTVLQVFLAAAVTALAALAGLDVVVAGALGIAAAAAVPLAWPAPRQQPEP
ncbi:hypothetical protein AVL62_00720 [Serinicoccus chungangensis]|uniref:Uncharacterized protein n=1 Tax=Serinicoccus chungangensis TaxID=767452 RepID=A0A0W8I519_9MICO|nr:hypothetical protein [Serinicoccus chungangensis]KUG53360.1 hypothetical protein AVL62_00720 [Serinicoccus chungangensis]